MYTIIFIIEQKNNVINVIRRIIKNVHYYNTFIAIFFCTIFSVLFSCTIILYYRISVYCLITTYEIFCNSSIINAWDRKNWIKIIFNCSRVHKSFQAYNWTITNVFKKNIKQSTNLFRIIGKIRETKNRENKKDFILLYKL